MWEFEILWMLYKAIMWTGFFIAAMFNTSNTFRFWVLIGISVGIAT